LILRSPSTQQKKFPPLGSLELEIGLARWHTDDGLVRQQHGSQVAAIDAACGVEQKAEWIKRS
jgi:hypothetical protein